MEGASFADPVGESPKRKRMTEQNKVRKNSASKFKGGILSERMEVPVNLLGRHVSYAPDVISESANTSAELTDRSGYTESASITVNHDKNFHSYDQSGIENNYQENVEIDSRDASREFQAPLSSAFTTLRNGHNPEQSSMETSKEENSSIVFDQSSGQIVSDNDRSQLNVSTSSIGDMINPLAIDSPRRECDHDGKDDDASNEKKAGESALSSISSAGSPGGFIPEPNGHIDMQNVAGGSSSSSSSSSRKGRSGFSRAPYRHSDSGFLSLFGGPTAPGDENESGNSNSDDEHTSRLVMGSGGMDSSPFRRRRSDPVGASLQSSQASSTTSSGVWPTRWMGQGGDGLMDAEDDGDAVRSLHASQRLRFTPAVAGGASPFREGAAESPPPPFIICDSSGMLSGSLSNLSVSHARGTRKSGAKKGASSSSQMCYSSEDELPGSRRPRSPVLPYGSSSFNEALSNASGSPDLELSAGSAAGPVSALERREAEARSGRARASTPAAKDAPAAFASIDLGTPVAAIGSPAVLDLGAENPISDRRGATDDADGERDLGISKYRREAYRRSSGPPSVFVSSGGGSTSGRKPRSRSHTGVHSASGESKFPDRPSPIVPRARPLPDQSAFDRNFSGRIDQPLSPVCPATPMRTPTWSHDGGDRSRDRPLRGSHSKPSSDLALDSSIPPMPALLRTDSLQTNKVLSQSDAFGGLHGGSVDFKRDFVDEGLLGSGTFADVYRARQKEDGKLYAVKKVKRQFRSKKDRDWLLNEVRSLMRVGTAPCMYIVQFVRAWQDDGYFYVQIELAGRGTLRDLLLKSSLAKQALPDGTLWHVIHNVASGLRHIHSCGLVHLDIKPANLLISDDGVVKIGDFGTASQVGEGEDGREGDTRYMAPELLQSSERHPPGDVFSLGLSLYEIGLPYLTAPSAPHRAHAAEEMESSLCADRLCLNRFSAFLTGNGGSCLPTEGTLWHVLREGRAEALPGRSPALLRVIAACMDPSAAARPLTSTLLELPEVAAAEGEVDPTLMSATSRLLAVAGPPPTHGLPPSHSTDARGIGRTGSLPKLQMELPVNSAVGDDRAFTPTALMHSGGGYYFSPAPQIGAATGTGRDEDNDNAKQPNHGIKGRGLHLGGELQEASDADINKAKASNGCTPSYTASEKGHVDVVRMLLEQGADINKARDIGATPLYIASQMGHVEVVRMLLEQGADIHLSWRGQTPLQTARQRNHAEIARLLELAAQVQPSAPSR